MILVEPKNHPDQIHRDVGQRTLLERLILQLYVAIPAELTSPDVIGLGHSVGAQDFESLIDFHRKVGEESATTYCGQIQFICHQRRIRRHSELSEERAQRLLLSYHSSWLAAFWK
ncbi:hypothetical protein BKA69DRAFT_1078226 [Paraphysoderma sedebokerense]|nr:hypothetical protein BKA69DRAFT_1078226 [Paraphysoderma sedebokerense]